MNMEDRLDGGAELVEFAEHPLYVRRGHVCDDCGDCNGCEHCGSEVSWNVAVVDRNGVERLKFRPAQALQLAGALTVAANEAMVACLRSAYALYRDAAECARERVVDCTAIDDVALCDGEMVVISVKDANDEKATINLGLDAAMRLVAEVQDRLGFQDQADAEARS